ncbi:MAG: type II secretion system F family protein [Patescibacteria group bacterium]|uniref:Type II secretion system F family protein n=1 Tax=candidate division WWE3 bacterium TaxID=2053526 RepID=A0A955EAX8_UNCKA|nr:type II secretion system F family protein [candidate division WWE3 bacterium]
MAVYNYNARDNAGNMVTGTVDARSKDAAAELLKAQNLFVVSINEKQKTISDDLSDIFGVPYTEIVAFTRQLSTMISAGLPISRALDVLSQQTANKRLQKILLDCLHDVEGGTSLNQAFARHPAEFNQTYVALVRAGESSGRLDEILVDLATSMEADRELNSKFKAAMVYPVIVILAMVGVFVMMLVFVIPQLSNLYSSLDVQLPGITLAMIALSDFFINRWYIVLVLTIASIFGIKSYISTPSGKKLLSELSFTVPVFGKINRLKELAQFTRTLSLLISAAIPIVEALNIVSDVARNDKIKAASKEASLNVEKGNSLSSYLKYNTEVFPPIISQMAAVGEETGELENVLKTVSDYFDSEVEHAVKGLSAALEPIILIMLGSMVAVLIISIITPIYQITNSL